ncbi:MAG TPA: helix-turn-helix transcriptional regulator [Candidatus Deferrimicrobium sp.]|nr:helix-turn-helix transcriptional regulator [Candidatus Kapabacteria bacterium]HLP58623.1 helix-turn-helix transcriptional regulator [Candidatus Deferrimicrobium sp.]
MAKYIMKRETVADVGLRIKAVRQQLKLQQKEMAATMQIAPSYLSEIEGGKANPGPEFFLKLAYNYNISPNYLFLGTGEMLLGPERPIQSDDFDLERENIDSLEKLLWMIDNSSFFKNTILAQADRIYIENENIIKKNIQKNKPTKEKNSK